MDSFLARLHSFLRTFGASSDPAQIPPRPPSKSYARFPQKKLSQNVAPTMPLADVLKARASWLGKDPAGMQSLSFDHRSAILSHACRQQNGRRPHPSGGARYPLEIYVFAFNVEELERGVHHYNPEENTLEYLWEFPEGEENTQAYSRTDEGLCDEAPALIVVSALWHRSASKYKGLAFELTLTESGHVGQNIVLIATAIRTPVRPLFSFDDAAIAKALDIDTLVEQPIYLIALGGSPAR
jgi:SagB-type dehydrogenase family enzyme